MRGLCGEYMRGLCGEYMKGLYKWYVRGLYNLHRKGVYGDIYVGTFRSVPVYRECVYKRFPCIWQRYVDRICLL